MNLVIFWSTLAFAYFALSVVTFVALYKLKQDLSRLDEMSPSGISNKKGNIIPVESTLYKALKAILITDIVGFSAATAAAIVSAIITT
jgi:hypothetical protein